VKELSITHNNMTFAIIVRERDRPEHKLRFQKHMATFLKGQSYHIYYIIQSPEGAFNVGKISNAGFKHVTKQPIKYSHVIFHHIDLLPSLELLSFYLQVPNPMEILKIDRPIPRFASITVRKMLGAIISMTPETYTAVDGYPNVFWGWGGEDGEFYLRSTIHCHITESTIGTMTDIDTPRKPRTACQLRFVLIGDHEHYRNRTPKPQWWGLSGCLSSELGNESLNSNETNVTVDVASPKLLEDHWINRVPLIAPPYIRMLALTWNHKNKRKIVS
jgi:hypothetical protein